MLPSWPGLLGLAGGGGTLLLLGFLAGLVWICGGMLPLLGFLAWVVAIDSTGGASLLLLPPWVLATWVPSSLARLATSEPDLAKAVGGGLTISIFIVARAGVFTGSALIRPAGVASFRSIWRGQRLGIHLELRALAWLGAIISDYIYIQAGQETIN